MTEPLHSFCKFNRLNKSTVYNYLVDQGFSLSEGMSPEAVAAAREKFLPKAPKRDDQPIPTQVVTPAGYADPFSGVSPTGGIVPSGFTATNRSLATSGAAQRVQAICQGATLHTQQTVAAALDNGDQMGQQLGAFLAERIILAAETQKQGLIQEYLQSQGVQVGKPAGGDSPA